jgi:hypothetical protein
MKTELNFRRVLLLMAVFLLAIGAWFLSRPAEPPAAQDLATGTAVVAPEKETPAENDEAGNDAGLMHTLTIEAPASEAQTTAALSKTDAPIALSAEQIISMRDIETEIEAAFAGDNNEAIELGGFLNECRYMFLNEDRVERSIARVARAFAEGQSPKKFRPNAPAQEFDSLESFEENQWATFYRCEAARELVNESFWQRLAHEAEAGNPVARYLFATLQRNPAATVFRFDQWDESLEHDEQARDYTLRNMEEREPLGLLALAHLESSGSRNSMFNASVSGVLSLAAVKCGLATPDLLDSIDQMLEQVKRMEVAHPGALAELNTASDEAKRMFCN